VAWSWFHMRGGLCPGEGLAGVGEAEGPRVGLPVGPRVGAALGAWGRGEEEDTRSGGFDCCSVRMDGWPWVRVVMIPSIP
jgi:hypothetical protein